MNRRTALELALTAGLASLISRCKRELPGPARPSEEKAPMSETHSAPGERPVPSIFLAHGSPYLLDDQAWTAELAAWARALPRPKSILMISAHWLDQPVTLGATRTVPLVYDFYGFPEKYYRVEYRAPGAPALADRVRTLLANAGGVKDDPKRGLDHGAYVPLVAMYPEADVPVLQISIPTMDPSALIGLGRALAPLRQEGVLIVGSGFLTHNLRTIQWRAASSTPSWAAEFDSWTEAALAKRDVDALVGYKERAPGVGMALPSHEHFVPVLVALGAGLDAPNVTFPITGFTYGSFTKRSVQFG